MVDALCKEEALGNLINALIFLCTDNSMVEASSEKGNSSSEKLFKLTLEVRLIEMRNNMVCMILSHTSGERMKDQGTDRCPGVSSREECLPARICCCSSLSFKCYRTVTSSGSLAQIMVGR
jgi:hypothetical protein